MLGKDILHYFYFEHVNDKCYFTDRSINATDTSLKPIIDLVKEKKPECILYNYPTEATVNWLMDCFEQDKFFLHEDFISLEKVLIENNCHFYLILGGYYPDIFKFFDNGGIKNFKILYWPEYLISHTYDGIKNLLLHPRGINGPNSVFESSITKKFNKLYINLNNKPRFHRCVMIDQIYKNDLFNFGINSWNLKFNECDTNWDLIDSTRRNYTFKYWNETHLFVDTYKSENSPHIDEYTDIILDSGCLFSLVGESSMVAPFITEKTFRPILLEHPFICYGAKGQNKELLKFGFELYDEIFDYDFDDKENIDDRVIGLLENLDKHKNNDYMNIYNILLPKIKRNKKRALEILFNDIGNPYIDFYQKYNPKIDKTS